MVQMKVYGKDFGLSWHKIYIPHGSDESLIKNEEIRYRQVIYIPHGSDESIWTAGIKYTFNNIYIPHGSDERYTIRIYHDGELKFISHMVQMKVVQLSPLHQE